MTIGEARMLLKLAFEEKDDSTRKVLIKFADKLLADIEKKINPRLGDLKFPIPIFRRYKGTLYKGELLKDWKVAINGDVYTSPSAASIAISGHPENGWRTWRYIDESNDSEKPIDKIRRMEN